MDQESSHTLLFKMSLNMNEAVWPQRSDTVAELLSSGGTEVRSYVCDFGGCGKSFGSTRGLRIHQGKVHAPNVQWTEAELRQGSQLESKWRPCRGEVETGIKRWSGEEMRLLARVEFNYRDVCGSAARFVAPVVMELGVNRNYNAIQRKLNCPSYHAIRKEVWDALTMERTQDVPDECLIHPTETEPVDNQMSREVRLQRFVTILNTAKRSGEEKFVIDFDEELLDHLVDLAAVYCPAEHLRFMMNDYFRNLASRFAKPRRPKGPSVRVKRSARLERAWKFVRTQRLWRANRSRTARDILNGRTGAEKSPLEIPGFMKHWKSTFKPAETKVSTEGMVPQGEAFTVWNPVHESEIRTALSSMNVKTCSGPDGIKVSQLKHLPGRILTKWFNLIMYCGVIPPCLKKSTTVFIPKKDNPESPSDYRPISMSSVVLRLFNKILADRLLRKVQFDHRQKAFIPIDGCAENIALLEAVLRRASRGKSNLFLAMLDMKNAYGSVAHEAVFRALELKGADKETVEYIRDLYRNYITVLTSRGKENVVVVQRGILQGDPLSPILFNMVIDQILRVLPNEVGFPLSNDINVNGMAFADDLNVMTQSAAGMQVCLRFIEDAAKPLGLEFNAKKCSVLASITRKRGGMMVAQVDKGFQFVIGGSRIPMVSDGDSFRYLGAYFSARGMTAGQDLLSVWLNRLRTARLMPSQKLYVLRTHLVPKLIHMLSFARLRVGLLESMDAKIRKFLCRNGILRLPRSTPVDYFYAAVADGGLGLMSLRRSIPAIILNRFERLLGCGDPVIECAANMEANLRRISNASGALVTFEGVLGCNREAIQVVNRGCLYQRMDAAGLEQAHVAPYAHQWLSSGGTEFLGNRQFIEAVQMRINALPTKSRLYRGVDYSRRCRAGCHQPETNNHIMQCCGSTRDSRRERHNRVVEKLADELRATNFTNVMVTPTIRAAATVWYPDLIALRGETAFVVDAHIIGDQADSAAAYRAKVHKYMSVPSFSRRVMDLCPGATTVRYGAVIINRKGVIALQTELFRRKELKLTKGAMQRIVLLVIQGSLRIYHQFVKGNKPYRFKCLRRSTPGQLVTRRGPATGYRFTGSA